MANYKWDAKGYAENSQNQFQWAQELIPKLRLRGNDALLDIGCGDGKITAELAACLPDGKVVGIDSSQDMIKLARQNFPSENHPNLSFVLMDARNLTFREEFDRVFSNAALHWIVNQRPVLEGVNRSLRSGGKLLFQMAGKGNARDVLIVMNELITSEPWKKYFHDFVFPYGFYDPTQYSEFLEDAGLVPERVELFPKDMKFPDVEDFAAWIRTCWLPYTERVPEVQRAEFIQQIVKRYLHEHSQDAAGVVHVDMMRIEVQARKA